MGGDRDWRGIAEEIRPFRQAPPDPSAGVSALLRVHRQAAATGTQLRVVASPAVRRVLDLTGADQVLDTYPSLADALAGRHAPSVM